MQQNKLILLLLFLCNYFYAQPSMHQMRNAPEIIFSIKDSKNKDIKFTTKDSLFFYSSTKKYSLTLSLKKKIYKFSNNLKDSIALIMPICLYPKCQHLYGNEYNFSRNSQNFDIDEYHFRLIYGVSERERESELPFFYYYKSVVEMKIAYKMKYMLVRLDFTKNLEKKFRKIELQIKFKEGVFEINNPESPMLLEVSRL